LTHTGGPPHLEVPIVSGGGNYTFHGNASLFAAAAWKRRIDSSSMLRPQDRQEVRGNVVHHAVAAFTPAADELTFSRRLIQPMLVGTGVGFAFIVPFGHEFITNLVATWRVDSPGHNENKERTLQVARDGASIDGDPQSSARMCNLYSVTTNREAIRRISQALNDSIGNLPELPGIYPDYLAPIVKLDQLGRREIVLARWGLASLKDSPATEKPNRGTTNVRHPWFDDWKGYLGPEHRCLVPLTRFAEPCKLEDGSSGNAWFALSKDEPLTFFAGLWTSWTGMRRKDEGVMDHLIFAFFTTEPNDVVGAVHQKAMPVILNSEEDREAWLTAPWSEARKLQRPLADGELEIVHRTALKYLPGVEGIPSGDPLRMSQPKEPSLF